MKSLNLLFSDAKFFLSNEVNRVFIAVVIFSAAMTTLIYLRTEAVLTSNNEVLEAIQKAEKKVDFRYFNTTRSLERIHNVEIDTKDGRLINTYLPNSKD